MRRGAIILVGLGVLIGPGAAWLAGGALRPEAPGAFAAPGLDPLTPEAAVGDMMRLAPALLSGVYDAFGRTSEAEIYDGLARVAHGEALEALYLERAGALASGGLDAAADQAIHEMRVREVRTRREGDGLHVDARWDVIGLVGHAEHQHVRGNTYRADLVLAPVDDAWRITGFTLREVDRSGAGEAVREAAAWWN